MSAYQTMRAAAHFALGGRPTLALTALSPCQRQTNSASIRTTLAAVKADTTEEVKNELWKMVVFRTRVGKK